jgi:large subunit ribosomal protein L10
MASENLQRKTQLIAEMREEVQKASVVLFLDYTGLTVAEADGLRRKLRDSRVGYRVMKNTLMARVLEGTPYESAKNCLSGTPTGVVIGNDDPVASAKAAYDYLKECEHLKVKGGVLDNQAIAPAQAEALSKMPGRLEMLAMVVGQAMSPGRNLVAQIKSPAGRIVGVLDTLAKDGAQ